MAQSVRYAWNGDVSLAYEMIAGGTCDLVLLAGAPTNLDLQRESEPYARFLRGLASKRRLIVTDRRGTGLSDRFSPTDVPPVEALTDDPRCVMDAAESEQAVVMAWGETAMVAMLFAAAHPERCAGLVLLDPVAVWVQSSETTWMPSTEEWEGILSDTRSRWGTRTSARVAFRDEREREWFLRLAREPSRPVRSSPRCAGGSRPTMRGVLPSIHVPVLILADENGDGYSDPRSSRYITTRLPSSRLVSYRSDGSWFGLPIEQVLAEVEVSFEEAGSFDPLLDRVLATIMFTDIVDSTAGAVELGDRRWRELLERHHAVTRQFLRRWREEELDVAGDGFFARFDGPARAVRCALDITSRVRDLGLQLRAGVHLRMRADRREGRRLGGAHRGPGRGTCRTRRGARSAHRARPGCRIGHRIRGMWIGAAQGNSGRVGSLRSERDVARAVLGCARHDSNVRPLRPPGLEPVSPRDFAVGRLLT